MNSKLLSAALTGFKPGLSLSPERIWTDSRTIERGDLFVAVPGEKFDGHDYVKMAADRGAIGAIVSKSDFPGHADLPGNFSLIQVPNTTQALRMIAKFYRRELRIPIFAVAGSNGKTTTKEWLGYLLRELHPDKKIFKTERSNNSILGIAMSLLQIRDEAAAVIEIGIDEPGWMDQHLEVVSPTHGVITTIAEEHLEKLQSIENVANEELKLLEYLKRTQGGFVANLDSPWIQKQSFPENSFTYALDQFADLEAKFLSPNTLHAFGMEWKNPLPGKHNAQNLLAAIACIRLLHPEIEMEHLKKLAGSISKFEGEKHRSLWLELPNQIHLFDDCYNANPDSMEKSLETFIQLSEGRVRRAVLGDMLDLGEATENAHKRILNLAIVFGFDSIYLYGPRFQRAYEHLQRKEKNIRVFSDHESLGASVKSDLRSGDTILLKGSRGMALEKIIPVISPQSK